ncbi:acylglycerol kinase family protein [Candidatus Saccharibacteria bacterium]|nr:acylglycerol kinase family protein [Candidatus Saccharibacteria bacterium]
MQRLLLIYNPHSSNYRRVRDEVIFRVMKLNGYMIGKFAIEKIPFEENVKNLKKVLRSGDIAIAAGGDATAAVTANAILESKKDVTLGVLPYGNFNDLARTLGTMKYDDDFLKQKVKKLYPLDIIVDGKHWRYATCYVTAGMTAEAVEVFDEPKFRRYMQKGHKSSWRSYLKLAEWYFKNRRKKVFLPPFTLNGKPTKNGVSDYCALSGKSMCRVMKGGDDYLKPKVFRSENCRLINFWRLSKLMMISMFKRTPGTETKEDLLEFLAPATVELQAEGEYKTFQNVKTILVKKPGQYIKVIHK